MIGVIRMNRDVHPLRMAWKWGKWEMLVIPPEPAQRIQTYLEALGHGNDFDGPLLRPLHPHGTGQSVRRHLNPDGVDRIF
jgi:hypothetical protein